MKKLHPHSFRLTDRQARQLAYLTQVYGSGSSALRVAIDFLYTLRQLEELGQVDTMQLREALDRLESDNK